MKKGLRLKNKRSILKTLISIILIFSIVFELLPGTGIFISKTGSNITSAASGIINGITPIISPPAIVGPNDVGIISGAHSEMGRIRLCDDGKFYITWTRGLYCVSEDGENWEYKQAIFPYPNPKPNYADDTSTLHSSTSSNGKIAVLINNINYHPADSKREIYFSNDNGTSWVYKGELGENTDVGGMGPRSIYDLTQPDPTSGKYFITGEKKIYSFSDSTGIQTVYNPGSNIKLNVIESSVVNKNHIVAVGTNGTVIYSGNGGISFNKLPSSIALNSTANFKFLAEDTLRGGFITADKNTGKIYLLRFSNNQLVPQPFNNLIVTGANLSDFRPDSIAKSEDSNIYVAVCGNKIFKSPNLVDWTFVLDTYLPLKGVVYGNNKFVAAGDFGLIYSSENGTDWTKRGEYMDVVSSKIWDGNKILVSNSNFERDPVTKKLRPLYASILTSVDSKKWEATKIKPINEPETLYVKDTEICELSYNNKIRVAVGGNRTTTLGTIYSSYDGFNWKETFRTNECLRFVLWNGSKFIATGVNGGRYVSNNGETWTKQSSSNLSNIGINQIIKTKFGYYSVGNYKDSNNVIHGVVNTSTDGITWDNTPVFKKSSTTLSSITYGNDKIMIAGNSGYMAYSEDGSNWTEVNSNFITLANIHDPNETKYSDYIVGWNGRFILMGHKKLFTSYDGINWKENYFYQTSWGPRILFSDDNSTFLGCANNVILKEKNPKIDNSFIMQHLVCREGGTLSGNLNGSIPLKTGEKATLVEKPQNGIATVNSNGNYSYTPNAGFNGTDTFKWVITSGLFAASSVATVEVSVLNMDIDVFKGNTKYRIKGFGQNLFKNWKNQEPYLIRDIVPLEPNLFDGSITIDSKGYLNFKMTNSSAIDSTKLKISLSKNVGGTSTVIVPETEFTLNFHDYNSDLLDQPTFNTRANQVLSDINPTSTKPEIIAAMTQVCELVEKAPDQDSSKDFVNKTLEKLLQNYNSQLLRDTDIMVGVDSVAASLLDKLCLYDIYGYNFLGKATGEIELPSDSSPERASMDSHFDKIISNVSEVKNLFKNSNFELFSKNQIKISLRSPKKNSSFDTDISSQLIKYIKDKGINSITVSYNDLAYTINSDSPDFNNSTNYKSYKFVVNKVLNNLLPNEISNLYTGNNLFDFKIWAKDNLSNEINLSNFDNAIKLSIKYDLSAEPEPQKYSAFYVNNIELENMAGVYNPYLKRMSMNSSHLSFFLLNQRTIRFNDVPQENWANSFVSALSSKGIISGYNNNFSPQDSVTRSEFCTMLVNTFGILNPTATSSFTDVKEEDWFYKHVSSAYNKGVIAGTTTTPPLSFDPSGNIKRQDGAVIIKNTLVNLFGFNGLPLSNTDSLLSKYYDKADINNYAINSSALVTALSIINGIPDNGKLKFYPKSPIPPSNDKIPQAFITKAMAATILYKTLVLTETGTFAYYNGNLNNSSNIIDVN